MLRHGPRRRISSGLKKPSLLRGNLSQFEQAIRHRRGLQGGFGEARQHGGKIVAAVEPVLELGEIAGHVLWRDRAGGAGDRGRDVPERGVAPLESRRACCPCAGAGLDGRVPASGLGDGSEATETVADHLAGEIQAALGKALDSAAAEAADPAQLQPHRLALRRGLDRRQKGRLAGRAAATLAARALAAEIGIVELNAAREQRLGVALQHHLPELVFDGPGGALGHAEAAAQLDAGDALLRLGHVVEGAEPGPQRHLGGGEDGAGGQRGLASAGPALEQLARPDRAMPPLAADRALEALGPAPAKERLTAGRFSAVLLLELGFAEPLESGGEKIPHGSGWVVWPRRRKIGALPSLSSWWRT